MMVENKQIKMSFSLLLMLQITVAAGKISSVVRRGDDAMLSCANLNVHDCGQITFFFTQDTYRTELVQRGQIKSNGKVTTDRLRMTANCSLVIKEVEPNDAGLYHCQKNRHQQVEYTENWLSVVSINKQEVDEKIELTCSVSTYVQCTHPVKWLYEENEVTKNNKNIWLSQDICWSTVTFKKSIDTESFTCKVEDKNTGNIHLFPFRPQSSGGDTTTTASTTTKTTQGSKSQTTSSATDGISHSPITRFNWWWYIAVAVGLLVLLVIVIVVIKWRRNKGSKKQKNSSVAVSLDTAEFPFSAENIQEPVDPENGICYASVNYTKRTKSKKQVPDMDDAEETVTYSTVKCSRSSGVASTDLNDLYASVKK
ncbi:uncharacterized protein LOC115415496 [Sphaeramia orbicularis]|uniref:uncharacterized protein LOC115415496 n=1 Tax=Sphaeramia orbicularis TaxID=375764 RepID=UPI00117F2CDB|nr:uncharacterized protein LOC115415496 [Sphaeramia orbicularis]